VSALRSHAALLSREGAQVGKVVGYEGSVGGDAFALNADKKPHNPITLSGALAVCGALRCSYAPLVSISDSCPVA
jgi:hypothetical protein